MFMSQLQEALLFTIHSVFSVYIAIVLLRFILQLVRANFYNPVAQFAVKITNPLVIPLRKIIPSVAKIDLSTLILALLLQGLEIILLLTIKGFSVASASAIGGILVWSCGEIIDLMLLILLIATLINVILSWVQPNSYNPTAVTIEQITNPLYTPVRRVVPTIAMLDLSPMIVMFLITLSRILIADPIILLGKSLYR